MDQPVGALPEERYKCPECFDTDWVEVTGPDGRLISVKPCRHCRVVTHTRWVGGHFDVADCAGRGCAECAGIRNGTVTRFDYAPDGSFIGAAG